MRSRVAWATEKKKKKPQIKQILSATLNFKVLQLYYEQIMIFLKCSLKVWKGLKF